jgi:hypothetical protein
MKQALECVGSISFSWVLPTKEPSCHSIETNSMTNTRSTRGIKIYLFFFLLAMVGVELRASWATLPAIFVLIIFEIGSHFKPGPAWSWSTILFVLSYMLSHWLRWGPVNFLSKLVLNHDPPYLHLLSSWDWKLQLPCLVWNTFFKFHFFSRKSDLQLIVIFFLPF